MKQATPRLNHIQIRCVCSDCLKITLSMTDYYIRHNLFMPEATREHNMVVDEFQAREEDCPAKVPLVEGDRVRTFLPLNYFKQGQACDKCKDLIDTYEV